MLAADVAPIEIAAAMASAVDDMRMASAKDHSVLEAEDEVQEEDESKVFEQLMATFASGGADFC